VAAPRIFCFSIYRGEVNLIKINCLTNALASRRRCF